MVFKAISQREALQAHSILYALDRLIDRLIVEPRYQLTIIAKTKRSIKTHLCGLYIFKCSLACILFARGAFHPPYCSNTCTEKSVSRVLVYSMWGGIY